MKKKLRIFLLLVVILELSSAMIVGKVVLIKKLSSLHPALPKGIKTVYFNWCNGNKNFNADSLDIFQVDFSKADRLSESELKTLLDNFSLRTVKIDSSFSELSQVPKGDILYVNDCFQRELFIFAKVSREVVISEHERHPFYYADRSYLVWLFFGWVTIESGSVAGP
jgi:hypothetical protein